MNIDHMIKMANEIASFWEGELGEAAANEVATHLRRYWEPRMRAQMIAYYEERQGAGLDDMARKAVGLLAAQAKAATAAEAPETASVKDKVAPANDFSRTPNAADPYGGDAG
jgi:formate dehydrogenase subunit delta